MKKESIFYRKSLLLFILVILLFSCVKKEEKKIINLPQEVIVEESGLITGFSTTDRLSIRIEPYVSSKKITSINENEFVIIKGITDWEQIIDNLIGPWYLVTTKEVEGWCFGGYIALNLTNDQNKKSVPIIFDYQKPIDPTKFNRNIFIDNPFQDNVISRPSLLIRNLSELSVIYTINSEIKIEDVINRYDDSINDKQYIISNENYYIIYYYSTLKDEYYLELFQILTNNEMLKYNIEIGMSELDIQNICGKESGKNSHQKNYELYYTGKDYGQVNFSFNLDGKLTAINLWY